MRRATLCKPAVERESYPYLLQCILGSRRTAPDGIFEKLEEDEDGKELMMQHYN